LTQSIKYVKLYISYIIYINYMEMLSFV